MLGVKLMEIRNNKMTEQQRWDFDVANHIKLYTYDDNYKYVQSFNTPDHVTDTKICRFNLQNLSFYTCFIAFTGAVSLFLT